jgi:hypothetical protein
MKTEPEKRVQHQKRAKDLGTYIVFGFLVGLLVGSATGNLTLWTGTGICLGILIGAISSARDSNG